MPERTVYCEDAIPWLRAHQKDGGRAAVISSLPDAAETGMEIPVWQSWFTGAAQLAMTYAHPDCTAIFYQTDRKGDSQTYSKAHLLFKAAARCGMTMLWHKIAMRREPGKIDLFRPGYTHLIAFSMRGGPGGRDALTPDVFLAGEMAYENAMGQSAAAIAAHFAARARPALICDPFCGSGTVLATANALGIDAIGVDLDPAQCDRARALQLSTR